MSGHPLIAICALAVAILLVLLSCISTDYVRVTGMSQVLNDQVVYISAARSLVESGVPRSTVIYPSLINQETTTNLLYLPGHYYALAVSFLFFGYSPTAAFIPSLLAYVVASCAFFAAVLKLHGRPTASLAVVLFMTFPPVLIFSCTAMAELTLLAACMLCFALFSYLPTRWKPYLGPLLLLLPLTFRETALILLVPMLAITFLESPRASRTRSSAIMLSLSILLAAILLKFGFGDRPSLFMARLFGDDFSLFGDAFLRERLSPTATDWAHAVSEKFLRNEALLSSLKGRSLTEVASLWSLILAIPAGVVLGLRRRDVRFVSYAAVGAGILLFLLATYKVWGFRGIRVMLISLPFAAIVVSQSLRDLFHPRFHRGVLVSTLVLGTFAGGAGFFAMFEDQEAEQARAVADTAFLESLGHDDRYLLVSPFWLSLDYVHEHYPVQWSFPPTNRETLTLLDQNFQIGTIVIPDRDPRISLSLADVAASGFRVVGEGLHRSAKYFVFRPRDSSSR
jgi:4-amino-4-deoxy-L-arabinose transferase-like glycosyltransferase